MLNAFYYNHTGPSWNEEAKRRSDRIIREQLEKELGSRAARRADRVAQV